MNRECHFCGHDCYVPDPRRQPAGLLRTCESGKAADREQLGYSIDEVRHEPFDGRKSLAPDFCPLVFLGPRPTPRDFMAEVQRIARAIVARLGAGDPVTTPAVSTAAMMLATGYFDPTRIEGMAAIAAAQAKPVMAFSSLVCREVIKVGDVLTSDNPPGGQFPIFGKDGHA